MGQDVVAGLGLSPVINASGTETVYGASPVSAEVIEAIAAILAVSVDIAQLQAAASATIARLTGAEAGFITGCTSASIVIACAACMTGLDLAAIERLPDTAHLPNEVVIQKGHTVNYGASITGDMRLSGARVVEIGDAAETGLYQLRAALNPRTAAGLYVISHHAVQTGMIGVKPFIAACHEAGVPVIVDMAAEYGWREAIAAGADLVLVSAQKAMGGPTAGVMAGRRALIRACYAQSRGVGRPMKAGKEAIVGAIAALVRWNGLDHAATGRAIATTARRLAERLKGHAGVSAIIIADETGNPFERVVLHIDPAVAGFSAYDLAQHLAGGNPRIILRSLYADRGILQIDVRRLDAAALDVVAGRILEGMSVRIGSTGRPPAPADRAGDAVLAWLAQGQAEP